MYKFYILILIIILSLSYLLDHKEIKAIYNNPENKEDNMSYIKITINLEKNTNSKNNNYIRLDIKYIQEMYNEFVNQINNLKKEYVSYIDASLTTIKTYYQLYK